MRFHAAVLPRAALYALPTTHGTHSTFYYRFYPTRRSAHYRALVAVFVEHLPLTSGWAWFGSAAVVTLVLAATCRLIAVTRTPDDLWHFSLTRLELARLRNSSLLRSGSRISCATTATTLLYYYALNLLLVKRSPVRYFLDWVLPGPRSRTVALCFWDCRTYTAILHRWAYAGCMSPYDAVPPTDLPCSPRDPPYITLRAFLGLQFDLCATRRNAMLTPPFLLPGPFVGSSSIAGFIPRCLWFPATQKLYPVAIPALSGPSPCKRCVVIVLVG